MTDEFERKAQEESRFAARQAEESTFFARKRAEDTAFLNRKAQDEKLFRDKQLADQRAYEEKQREFIEATRKNEDKKAVDLLKMVGTAALGMALVKYGAEQLAIKNQNYENITPLLEAGGILKDGKLDPAFTDKAISQSEDKLAATMFLASRGANFTISTFLHALGEPDAARAMVKSGRMDMDKDGPRALQYAAAMGQKGVFEELMKAGADPRKAITQGSNDARWDGNYSKVAQWADDIRAKNPALAEKSPSPVTMESAAVMKEARLGPVAAAAPPPKIK